MKFYEFYWSVFIEKLAYKFYFEENLLENLEKYKKDPDIIQVVKNILESEKFIKHQPKETINEKIGRAHVWTPVTL